MRATEVAVRAPRIAQMLAMGPALVDALGQHTADGMAQASEVCAHSGAQGTALMDVCQQLVPSIQVLVPRRGVWQWWRRFTGEALEQELMFDTHCAAVAQLIENGQAVRARLEEGLQQVHAERTGLAEVPSLIDEDIALGQALLANREALAQAGLHELDVARLHRRVGNLEALRTSFGLTLAQLDLAGRHAQAARDRFDEIHALLLPIWKQRLGAQRMADVAPHSQP